MKKIKSLLRLIGDKISFYGLTFLNFLVIKDKKKIYVFDRDLKKDNAYSLALEICTNDKYNDFYVYYYTKKEFDQKEFDKLIVVNSRLKSTWHKLRSAYVIYSYTEMRMMMPVKGQVILNTMHGSPLKRIEYMAMSSKFKYIKQLDKTFSHILCVSDFFKEFVKETYAASEQQCLVLGYPRNDNIFSLGQGDRLPFRIKDYSKTILWVPTWRRAATSGLNTESTVEFPILTNENIEVINDYLEEINICLIIKPHPFQEDLSFLTEKSHIKVINNNILNENNIEFYSLFPDVDALLTDYSSVYFDFLLTEKPIGFTIDDIDSYTENRGFVIDDPKSIMPGAELYNEDDLMKFLYDISKEIDPYLEHRKEINILSNKYRDNRSSERVLDAIIKGK